MARSRRDRLLAHPTSGPAAVGPAEASRQAHTPGWAVRGDRATPHADQAISAAKRWIIGTYNKPPLDHLPTYLAEFAFRREFADPATAFETLLRVLMTAPPTPKSKIANAADQPVVGAVVTPPKPKRKSAKEPARSRRRPAAPVGV